MPSAGTLHIKKSAPYCGCAESFGIFRAADPVRQVPKDAPVAGGVRECHPLLAKNVLIRDT